MTIFIERLVPGYQLNQPLSMDSFQDEISKKWTNRVISQTVGALPPQNSYKGLKRHVESYAGPTSWRELISSGTGRRYYYNTVTRTATYQMPLEYAKYIESRSHSASKGILTAEQREEIFFCVLRDKGVKMNWTWDEALRAIIEHPEYKIIPTLLERKATFQKYQLLLKEAEREEKRLGRSHALEAFKSLLRRLPELPRRWIDAERVIKDTVEFVGVEDCHEKIEAYDQIISERRHIDEVAAFLI